MSKTYKDSRRDRNSRDENSHRRFVKQKTQKRHQKFRNFVLIDEDDILLVAHAPEYMEFYEGTD